jgi:hypothetical protein
MQVKAASERAGRLAGRHLSVRGRLVDSVFMGAMVKYEVVLPSDQHVTVHSADKACRERLAVGEEVVVSWALSDQRIVPDC